MTTKLLSVDVVHKLDKDKNYKVIDNDSDKDNEYIRKYINKYLNSENLIILAGSGSSLTFNENDHKLAPSMYDLWNACKDDNDEKFKEIIELVSYHNHMRKDINEDSKEDIECLLSICDAKITHGEFKDIDRKKIVDFVKKAKTIILQKTKFTDKVPDDLWLSHNNFIRSFAKRGHKQNRLKIFTTNYDLAFEKAASNTGFIVIDGFEYSSPYYFNPMWFKYDIVNRNFSYKENTNYIYNVFHLYKIHGSVDWIKDSEGRVKKDYSSSNNSDSDTSVFIYPSSSKYQSSYESPYLDMMASFINAIQQPKTSLICIGFGFNDNHINNAIKMALRTNTDFSIMVVTLDLFDKKKSFNDEIRTFLESAIKSNDGRISLLDTDFKNFCRMIPNRRSSSPEEELNESLKNYIKYENQSTR